ncbi:MAG: lysophospholipid acyltransferase family protein [Acidobacteriales bacterium]|nr:lysophospholipid acyltransferase family protein [Terriglobales bacterium]
MAPDQHGQETFSLRQRLSLWLISGLGVLLIRLIGPTLRFRVEIEPGGPELADKDPLLVPAVYCFWHRCILPAAWFFRHRDIAVMTSRSYDGEYIARIIQRLGFRAVRGSSSRGAVRALLGMHTEIEQGRVAAFTIDGPRGPRYVAKPGPVLLARHTGVPIVVFHIAVERAWTLGSWDRMIIPKPFSRAVLCTSRIMTVPEDSDHDLRESKHAEMQAALDRVREKADAAFGQLG